MVRKRTGSVRFRNGVWYWGTRLRSGRWYERPIERPTDGGPYDEEYAWMVCTARVRAYESRTWDPEAAADAPPAEQTVAEFARAWAEGLDYESAPKDRARVELYLAPSELGRTRVRDVRPKHVVAWVGWLKDRDSERGGKLSPSAVRNAYDVLQRALDAAAVDELLAANPARLPAVRKGLPAKRDKHPGAREGWEFTREEIERLISDPAVKPERRLRYAILFLTGMRFGEFGALRWRDWDRKLRPLGRLTVARAIKSVSRREERTKTGAVKLVPVHPTLAAMLAEWHLSGWAAAFGRAPTPDDYVLPSVRGKRKGAPMNESAANRAFKADQAALGMRERHQHVARHAFITLAQDDGADGAVLRWATHAPPGSAFDKYTRTQWTRLCEEVAKLTIERREGAVVIPLHPAGVAGSG